MKCGPNGTGRRHSKCFFSVVFVFFVFFCFLSNLNYNDIFENYNSHHNCEYPFHALLKCRESDKIFLHDIVAHRLYKRKHIQQCTLSQCVRTRIGFSRRENALTHPHYTCVTCHLDCCCTVFVLHSPKCLGVVTDHSILSSVTRRAPRPLSGSHGGCTLDCQVCLVLGDQVHL